MPDTKPVADAANTQNATQDDTATSKPQTVKKGLAVRTQARRAVLQALYQHHINPTPQLNLELQFLNDPQVNLGSKEFFLSLLRGILQEVDTLDSTISSAIDRPIAQLNPIELSALRIGSFELIHEIATPYRVVINESIELTKAFGSEGGHAYVNGVLDKLAQQLRSAEVSAVAEAE
jgi:N utilization substance protein B